MKIRIASLFSFLALSLLVLIICTILENRRLVSTEQFHTVDTKARFEQIIKLNNGSYLDDGINSFVEKNLGNVDSGISGSGGTTVVTSLAPNIYSETNIQVEGVDEADTVKTDGRTIFWFDASRSVVNIYQGFPLSSFNLLSSFPVPKTSEGSCEMHVAVNRLIVTCSRIDDLNSLNMYKMVTMVYTYDISDLSKPVKLNRYVLDGAPKTTRLIQNELYVLTESRIYNNYNQYNDYGYYNNKIKDIDQLLPGFTVNDESHHVSYRDIYFIKTKKSYTFTTIYKIDIQNESDELQAKAFLLDSSVAYMSTEHLYLSSYDRLWQFSLQTLSPTANTLLDGHLLNQFSIDEDNETVRFGTTGYVSGLGTVNNVFVYDKKLNKLGGVVGIAENEQIKSVRFVGKTAYVVTFRQTDPLFVIDLSDAREPYIAGELKIPGFSTYLHPFSNTQIIGFGSDAQGGLKLSLFDVADPTRPMEAASISVGSDATSELSTNHKKLLFDKTRNLIGFPITIAGKDHYKMYHIDGKTGFNEVIDIDENAPKDAVFIEDTLYALSRDYVLFYDLNTFQPTLSDYKNP